MLLMFGVGLHFSLKDLMEVRRIALPGAVIQIAVAMGMGLARSADPLSELPMSVGLDKLKGQVVLVGYGRVGRAIARALVEQAVAYAVRSHSSEEAALLRSEHLGEVFVSEQELAETHSR